MLILVPKVTHRLTYIFRLLFTRISGIEVDFTTDIPSFELAGGPKLSYGVKSSSGIFQDAVSLLFETRVSVFRISYIKFDDLPAPFPVFDKDSLLPFDVFAASFYLVSRYEEYLPHIKDQHGRYLSADSEAARQGFLEKPLVNIWANKLGELLLLHFPGLSVRKREFRFLPSVDIDAAYAYKHKGFTRATGGFVKSLAAGNSKEWKERWLVALGRMPDPFDTFDYQQLLWQHFGLKPYYFVLFARYGPYDKNIPVNNRFFRNLIKSLADTAYVGIHPSYGSSGQVSVLSSEINDLARLLRRDVEISRQHFLRLELPGTYRDLLACDIKHDFSMGYAEAPGFRASICTEFPFYDLDEEAETALIIHPFAVMDGNFIDYQQVGPEQALEKMTEILQQVKAVGGDFIPLWHNQTLGATPFFDPWRKVFIRLVEQATGIRFTDE